MLGKLKPFGFIKYLLPIGKLKPLGLRIILCPADLLPYAWKWIAFYLVNFEIILSITNGWYCWINTNRYQPNSDEPSNMAKYYQRWLGNRIYKTEMKFWAVLGTWGCREKNLSTAISMQLFGWFFQLFVGKKNILNF